MNQTAGIRISARWHDRRLCDVRIDNARPSAARVLIGRTVHEAIGLVPQLFALCRQAQGFAARAACAAAGAQGIAHPASLHETVAIAAESMREHLGRLLMDWPLLFGATPAREAYVGAYKTLNRAQWRPAEAHRCAVAVSGLMARHFPAGSILPDADMARGPGRALIELIALGDDDGNALAASAPLQPRPAAAWAGRFDEIIAPGFSAAPHDQGDACETGVLVRHAEAPAVAQLLHRGNLMAARLIARVLDVLAGANTLRNPLQLRPTTLIDAAAGPRGCGVATVETARGLLLHAVRLDGDRIADYAIVAPTEWNLHPRGALAREASGRHAPSAARALLALKALALSLDPCVDFEVSLRSDPHA